MTTMRTNGMKGQRSPPVFRVFVSFSQSLLFSPEAQPALPWSWWPAVATSPHPCGCSYGQRRRCRSQRCACTWGINWKEQSEALKWASGWRWCWLTHPPGALSLVTLLHSLSCSPLNFPLLPPPPRLLVLICPCAVPLSPAVWSIWRSGCPPWPSWSVYQDA